MLLVSIVRMELGSTRTMGRSARRGMSLEGVGEDRGLVGRRWVETVVVPGWWWWLRRIASMGECRAEGVPAGLESSRRHGGNPVAVVVMALVMVSRGHREHERTGWRVVDGV